MKIIKLKEKKTFSKQISCISLIEKVLFYRLQIKCVMKVESVIGVVFSSDQKQVLLTKRRDVPVWVLPGGGIELNESPDEAIIREILEETGFYVTIKKKVGHYTPINRLAKYTYVYNCEIVKGNPMISSETKEVTFFPLETLPKLLPPPYDLWIQDALNPSLDLIEKKLDSVTYFTLLLNLFKHPILVTRFLLSKLGFTINT